MMFFRFVPTSFVVSVGGNQAKEEVVSASTRGHSHIIFPSHNLLLIMDGTMKSGGKRDEMVED
nr:hypothetical protein [Bacilli bacterium]